MRSSSVSKWLAVIFLVSSLCQLLSAASRAQTLATSPNALQGTPARPNADTISERQKEEFRSKMLGKTLPGSGCYEARPSDEAWKPVQCKPAPKPPSPLARGARIPFLVGKGTDDFAQVTGSISSVTSSFDSVIGVTDIFSPIYQDTSKTVYPNSYTFQLNANMFPTRATSACANVTTCQGWQQFIFSQRSGCGTACVYIEYWLFDSPSCPSDGSSACSCPGAPWISYRDPSGATTSGCFFNTPATGLPTPAVSDLGKLHFIGQANSNGSDVVTLQTADGVLHSKPYPASTLNLAQAWTGAEFNIFGDCCAYPSFFNPGSNLTLRLSTISTNPPTCNTTYFSGSTAETNDLNLVPNSCHPTTPSDIVFSEGGGEDPRDLGYGIGDPHLATLYKVHYDFQASGDFVLVQAGQDFIVQTRHKPVNSFVSVNTAVGTKMGNTQIAVCLPGRLEINGKPTTLADGKAIAYGQVLVSRKANVYEILGPGAAMVRAEITPGLINVYVSSGGINRENIRGLLGAAPGHILDLAMQDGTVLPNPPSYAQFTHYADSWRVKPNESLLCHGGAVAPGMPSRPTSAGDLNPSERERLSGICRKAGVKNGPLLEDCMLDVNVLGNQKWVTDAFVSAATPIKEITPTFP